MMAVAAPSLLPVSVLGAVVWLGWIVRQVLGARYRPTPEGHLASASVIVPVYREDPDVLERCLASWERENPNEIVLVIDHSEHDIIELAEAWAADDPRIRPVVVVPPGKRHALARGVREAQSDIVVLTDSDTLCAEG